jgi:uncharacterized membrane protein YeaQ/YmgE (transglycosylase-associated protein family)
VFSILSWLVYGVIVGGIARMIYRGDTPLGWVPTIATGVAGSVVGGLIHSALDGGRSHSAGIVFGVIGGVIATFAYTRFKSSNA